LLAILCVFWVLLGGEPFYCEIGKEVLENVKHCSVLLGEDTGGELVLWCWLRSVVVIDVGWTPGWEKLGV
jgi:hypothetical protein